MNWVKVNTYWYQLEALIVAYHPYYRRTHDHKISAANTEMESIGIRAAVAIESVGLGDPVVRARKAFFVKNEKVLKSILEETWFGMPESMESRAAAGFGVLCELLEEE